MGIFEKTDAPRREGSKTIGELINDMPKKYADLANKYKGEDWDDILIPRFQTPHDALANGIHWSKTDEGREFWANVYTEIKAAWDKEHGIDESPIILE